MRLLLLVDCYLPSTKSGAKQMHDLGVELRRQGHEVVVAAPDHALGALRQVTVEEGVTVLRVRTGRIKGASRLLRAVQEWRLSSVMWRGGRRLFHETPCDLVVYYSPTIFFGALVARLKQLWGCRSYLILRDIFPQWAVDAGLLRQGGPAYRFLRRKELQQYAAADVIGVQSPGNLRYFEQQGLAGRHRLEVLYNWTPTSGEPVALTHCRRELGLDGKVVFFYGGNMGVAQDMDNLVRLARSLRAEPDLHFLLVGAGSEVARLAALIRAEALPNVTIRPAVDHRTYLGMLSEFDVGLITLDRGLTTQNFPGKMLGYMYFSLPILASINPGNDLQELLERHEAGRVCLNGDDRRLAATALALARDSETRARVGANARRLLEATFSADRAARQILAHGPPAAG